MLRSRPKLGVKPIQPVSIVKAQFARSRTGSHRQRQKPVTQDSYAVSNRFQGRECDHFFVVCDGHGDYGHLVSTYITESLPSTFGKVFLQNRRDLELVSQSLQGCLKKLESELPTSNIDTCLSGTTVVAAFISENRLFVAHIGDSRAVIGSKYGSHWVPSQLTEDHKPENSDEARRILRNGGEVRKNLDSCRNPTGPYRVWLLGQDGPGLAMSRSIGDGYAKQAGVIADPDFKAVVLTPEDRFLVIATDGLWEVIDTEEVVNIVARKADRNSIEEAADDLVNEAHMRWRKMGDSVDDITVLVVVLEVGV